jgi:hypothetical protein
LALLGFEREYEVAFRLWVVKGLSSQLARLVR